MVIRGKHSIEFIYCGCGCGKTRFRYDTHGREFFYIKIGFKVGTFKKKGSEV